MGRNNLYRYSCGAILALAVIGAFGWSVLALPSPQRITQPVVDSTNVVRDLGEEWVLHADCSTDLSPSLSTVTGLAFLDASSNSTTNKLLYVEGIHNIGVRLFAYRNDASSAAGSTCDVYVRGWSGGGNGVSSTLMCRGRVLLKATATFGGDVITARHPVSDASTSCTFVECSAVSAATDANGNTGTSFRSHHSGGVAGQCEWVFDPQGYRWIIITVAARTSMDRVVVATRRIGG